MKTQRKWMIALSVIAGLLALCVGGVAVCAADYYRADEAALQAMTSTEAVTVERTAQGVAFLPEDPVAGFIFYPGGKVEHTAYAPLLHALAEQGVLCVLVEMPLNLAVLDMNAAEGIPAQYPEVTRWYIGGHSLGGAMAASFAAAHPEDFAGVALLAAYSTQPLPEKLQVVSLYGAADQVLNWQKFEECMAMLPEGAEVIAIPGGNHAQFGSYGVQNGDGTATITPQAQQNATVAALLEMIRGE